MKIDRKYFKPIRKRIIPLENLIKYEDIDIVSLNKLLNEVISDNIYNTFDLFNLVMKNYDGDLAKAIIDIKDYTNVRFNCYYACKILKKKLDMMNIKSYLISYKSIGFSTSIGDDLIKEAHTSLVVPTQRNDKVYYILMDPGLRIPEILGFYYDAYKTDILIDNDRITIKRNDDEVYNYTMIMTGYNRYSTNNTSYTCQEYFDLNHELLNPEEVLFPASFYVLSGYRIIRFSSQKEYQASIKFLYNEEYLEISSNQECKRVSFNELSEMNEEEFFKIIKSVVQVLILDGHKFYLLIRFMISIKDELKSISLCDAL